MAMAGAGTPPPPLRLKDLLELDCDSCSAAGFRCYPRRLCSESSAAPMRHLLLDSPGSLRRRSHPSKLSQYLSRSLSSISRGALFWTRRDDEIGGRRSCSEDPETATSSESSGNSSGRTSRRSSRSSSGSDFSTSASEESMHEAAALAAAGDERDHEEAMKRRRGSSSGSSEADDKEQLSPVGVMDFPLFDDDDDDATNAAAACSPSFSLQRLQRRKTHKIRRFGNGGDELGPVDLEALLAATSDDDDVTAPPPQQVIQCRAEDGAATTCAGAPDEHGGLISLLLMGMGAVSAGVDDDAASERLLLDFFVETQRRRSELARSAEAGGLVVDGEAVVAAARRWVEGTGTERWGLKEVLGGGEAVVAEMERGRRWMQVGEEEREVGAVVAGMLVDRLLDELVWDLIVW